MTEFKEALKNMSDRADWVLENFSTIESALKIADKLMQEPSKEMQYVGSGMHDKTGWKKPLRQGMRVASTQYDDKERASNCFEAMRDQMLKEIDQC